MTEDGPQAPAEVVEHYERTDEDARLRGAAAGELELARTQELIRRHLPPGGERLRVIDVGGGTGIHAEWLAADGHTVHVVDPVPGHVEQAATRAASITAEIGDARRLTAADASYDAVLLLGPLYHLTERTDRLAALREAARVVVPGGPVFAAAISRFASLFNGLTTGHLFDPAFRSIVERDLTDGQHRNPTGNPGWFTTAYFHHPSELALEVKAAGLYLAGVYGIEGMGAWQPHLAERWSDPDGRRVIVDSARAIESEPTLLGLGPHLLALANRPMGSGR
jgi:ubiquinone/menaquinone biosynthesis C-methylase UbiE